MSTEIICVAAIGALFIIIGLILTFKKHESFIILFLIGLVVLISSSVVSTIPQCPGCGKRYDSSYCIICGTEMSVKPETFCTTCDKEINNTKANFCPDCGTKLIEKTK